jgi:hypothetical protein
MKKAIFYLEPVVRYGIEGYIIKGWDNVLPAKKLPHEYFNYIKEPYFVSKNDFIAIIDYGRACYITRGMFLSLKDWDDCYQVMQRAGHRLSEILHKRIIKVEI